MSLPQPEHGMKMNTTKWERIQLKALEGCYKMQKIRPDWKYKFKKMIKLKNMKKEKDLGVVISNTLTRRANTRKSKEYAKSISKYEDSLYWYWWGYGKENNHIIQTAYNRVRSSGIEPLFEKTLWKNRKGTKSTHESCWCVALVSFSVIVYIRWIESIQIILIHGDSLNDWLRLISSSVKASKPRSKHHSSGRPH